MHKIAVKHVAGRCRYENFLSNVQICVICHYSAFGSQYIDNLYKRSVRNHAQERNEFGLQRWAHLKWSALYIIRFITLIFLRMFVILPADALAQEDNVGALNERLLGDWI
jgi:uncharacterized protein (DUF2225 family)